MNMYKLDKLSKINNLKKTEELKLIVRFLETNSNIIINELSFKILFIYNEETYKIMYDFSSDSERRRIILLSLKQKNYKKYERMCEFDSELQIINYLKNNIKN